MKKLTMSLIALGALLSGCAVYDDPYRDPYRDGQYRDGQYRQYPGDRDRQYRDDRDRDRDGVPDRMEYDRDRDGVPNQQDRYPDDPRRY